MSSAPVFVVGMPRSGTTLVAMILNASSHLTVSPETHYFGKFWRLCERRRCLESPRSFERFVRGFLESPRLESFGFGPGDVEEVLSRILAAEPSHRRVLDETLSYYAAKRGNLRWCEKTPEHVFYSRLILDLFPDARIVQVVRDPRDVVLSLRRVPWGPGNVLQHLQRWRRCIHHPAAQAIPDGSYHEVRYEDLLRVPESTVARLCRFLDMPFEPSMIDHHREAEPIYDLRHEPWKWKTATPLDPTNLQKWKREMNPLERELVSLVAANDLRAKGYEVEPIRSPVRVRLLFLRQAVGGAAQALLRLARRGFLRLLRDVRWKTGRCPG